MRLVVKMEVEGVGGGDATLRVVGPEGVAGEGTFGVPNGTEERWVTLVTGPLPDVVKAYTPASLSWSARPPDVEEFGSVGITSHRVYVTLGTPTGSESTNRRLNMLCNAAWEAGTPLEAIDGIDPQGVSGGIGIHARLDQDPPLDGRADAPNEIQADDWRLMSGYPYYGLCDHQAHLMNLALQLVGAGPAFEYFTYASTDTHVTSIETATAEALGVTQDLDGDGVAGESDEVLELIFDFDPDPDREEWNLFEGSIVAAGRYYTVWESFSADSQFELFCRVVDGLGATQRWVYRIIVDPVAGEWCVGYAHPGQVDPPGACPR